MALETIDRPLSVGRLSSTPDRLSKGIARHWLLLISLVLGIWTTLPWLAPVLMQAGWLGPARLIYFVYGFFCHQLPERSWFLFGPHLTPSLAEIQAAGGMGAGFFALRRFTGSPELGWKLAWSDRMVSFYGGWFLFALLYGLLRLRVPGLRPVGRGLRWQVALLLLIPMALDGGTHMISDLWGVTASFRQGNVWLAVLTANALPPSFYAGDAWGSFNSLARLVTGLLAAFALIFWLAPLIDRVLQSERSVAADSNGLL
jgi:uncharacterized membrane protein